MSELSLGGWLVLARERAGVSQRALARLSGVSQAQISKIEGGLVGSEPKTLDLLVSALAGPDATPEEVESLRREALAASVGLSREIERVPVDDPDFWDAYEGAPQEDRELAKQLLIRARDRERARTIGGTGG